MTDKLKKIIATAIATGSIVAGSAYGIQKANCDYVIINGQNEICITQEVYDAVKSQTGFGGIKFGE